MKRVLPLISALILLATTACRHKDLSLYSMPSRDVIVEYNWEKAPDAVPESMTAIFFRSDGESQDPVKVVFPGRNGGALRLPPGSYHAVTHNSEIYTWAHFRGTDDIDSYELYTESVDYLAVIGVDVRRLPRSSSSRDERIAVTPQMIWNNPQRDLNIIPDPNKTVKIVFTPEEAICYYDVTFTDVKNLKYLNDTRIDATLSGMAEGFHHGTHTPTSTPVTMAYTLYATNRADMPNNTLQSSFLTFGEPVGNAVNHTVSVYLLFEDGSAGSYNFDVTDQVRNAPDPKHVHILIKGLTLPKPIVNGGGMHPNVTEWETENIPIEMD